MRTYLVDAIATQMTYFSWQECPPISLGNLSPFLASHPDRSFAAYIRDGLSDGFRIGFDRGNTQLRSCSSNHPSALANEQVVQERITAEVAAGRLHGPLPPQMFTQVHTSPMGLVPKSHQSLWTYPTLEGAVLMTGSVLIALCIC